MVQMVKRGFGINGKSYYSNVNTPQDVNLQFTVTPTNGLGVTSVKSNGYVRNVFMHTSTTPAANNGYTNPNPANGLCVVQFYNPFNVFLNCQAQIIAPSTGSVKIDNGATLTPGGAYVISTLGDATAAQWLAVGVPPGVTPAVGVSFIAIATGGGSGNVSTSRVSTPASSGVVAVEMFGDPSASSFTSSIGVNGGAWAMLQFSGGTFTGDALAAHSHSFLVKGGQAASTTNNIAAYAGPLIGKEQATDATFAGGSATNGGVQTASAGTPSGALSVVASAPTAGTIVCLKFSYDGSSDTIDGL